ncbi:ATP-binding protein [Amycolatopsis acidicola]|uniref:ATP-binding protein n=1 Tax=Amycolatopsis acidicola TaxID=2596893 RepID=A0A5N0UMT2_9PSEU|nr:ATP/GTP-binding protein [Amycolatopsis acidicola]KAA9150319.1 ATP-binding protein [Amycolatopsis acidicola]
MPSGISDAERYLPPEVARSVKILVVGAFGVGKTTLIGAVSEIPPLSTEEVMTAASIGVDSLLGLASKRTTTVAMDFGRLTVGEDVALYLFGAPGQRRFWDLWEGLAEGAAGALVLVDTRRLEDSFEVFDQLERYPELPIVVAVNEFPDSPRYSVDSVRKALDLLPETPVITCDARERASSAGALSTLVEYALSFPTKASV